MACPEIREKEIAWHSQGPLKVMHVILFSRNGLVLDHPMLIGATVREQL